VQDRKGTIVSGICGLLEFLTAIVADVPAEQRMRMILHADKCFPGPQRVLWAA
jgi:hypothetical protein